MKYKNISEISLDDKSSWKGNVFLTLDIDWCSDEILEDTINLVESHNAKATWFITHDTPLLKKLRDNPNFELGIHPNFNKLMLGDYSLGKNMHEVVDHYMQIVPDAVSVRSHSITQSSLLLKYFLDIGLKFDNNCYIPKSAYEALSPWGLWGDKLIKVPYFWADDIHCLHSCDWNKHVEICPNSINVFDFHPIHVFLNSENLERYEDSRDVHDDFEELRKYRHKGNGTRTHLNKVLNLIK